MVAPPRFDFAGSLELARELVLLAEDIGIADTARRSARDVAIAADSFQGPYGEDHRGRAEEEDQFGQQIAESLEDCAKDWAKAWQTAADQMNEYAAYLAQEECDAMYQGRLQAWYRSAVYDPETNSYSYGPSPSRGSVTPPAPAPLPVGKAYAPESAFAKYYQSGLNMNCYYVDSPPV